MIFFTFRAKNRVSLPDSGGRSDNPDATLPDVTRLDWTAMEVLDRKKNAEQRRGYVANSTNPCFSFSLHP